MTTTIWAGPSTEAVGEANTRRWVAVASRVLYSETSIFARRGVETPHKPQVLWVILRRVSSGDEQGLCLFVLLVGVIFGA